MILDASAIVAVILGQADSAVLTRALVANAPSAVGAPTLAEAALVLQARLGPRGLADLRGFLVEFDVHAVPKLSGLPLLCVDGDFPQTDLTLAPLTA